MLSWNWLTAITAKIINMSSKINIGSGLQAVRANDLDPAQPLNGSETVILIQNGNVLRTSAAAFAALFNGLTSEQVQSLIEQYVSEQLQDPQEINKNAGQPVPIVIDGYQGKYASHGNNPMILVDQILPGGIRRTRNDLRADKTYIAGKLISFSITPSMVDDNGLTTENLIIIIK